MKFLIFFLLCFSLLVGCHSKKEIVPVGPLSQMHSFDVCVFFSPYEQFDREFLFDCLVDELKKIGSVEIMHTPNQWANNAENVVLFFSLGGYEQADMGSVQLISTVEVKKNGFKTACPIWCVNSHREGALEPIFENGRISFRANAQASPVKLDAQTVLRQMVVDFANEYHKCNSANDTPLLRIYQSM